jgi:predicted transcriptional regulator
MLSDLCSYESPESWSAKIEEQVHFLQENPRDQQVYRVLEENGPLCRQELCERTELAQSTAFDALKRLMIRGIVIQSSKPAKTAGRPRVYFEVNMYGLLS